MWGKGMDKDKVALAVRANSRMVSFRQRLDKLPLDWPTRPRLQAAYEAAGLEFEAAFGTLNKEEVSYFFFGVRRHPPSGSIYPEDQEALEARRASNQRNWQET
jgi:hypothetical protein